jgi:hypothetical protein
MLSSHWFMPPSLRIFYFKSSICCKAFYSFSCSWQSLSHLQASQHHFLLSAIWGFMFPQPLWNQCPHVAHCVPDFRFLSHPLHNTWKMFSVSTPVQDSAPHRWLLILQLKPLHTESYSLRNVLNFHCCFSLAQYAMKSSLPRYPLVFNNPLGSNPLIIALKGNMMLSTTL